MRRSNIGKVALILLVLCLMTACSSKTGKDGGNTPQGASQGDIVAVSQGYETSAVSVTLSKSEGSVDVEDKSGNALERISPMMNPRIALQMKYTAKKIRQPPKQPTLRRGRSSSAFLREIQIIIILILN